MMPAKYAKAALGYWREDDPEMCGPEPNVNHVWDIYALVKYWSRETHGPREPNGELSLDQLACAMINVIEATWRQGYRSEALREACFAEMKRRKIS